MRIDEIGYVQDDRRLVPEGARHCHDDVGMVNGGIYLQLLFAAQRRYPFGQDLAVARLDHAVLISCEQ